MKQTEQLGLLCVLFAGIVLWQVRGGEGPPTAGDKLAMNPVTAASPAADPSKVRLDLLGKSPVSAPPKNIFASLQSLEPPPPPPPPTVVELPPLPDIEEPLPPSPEALALAAAQKALSEIRAIGYLNKGADRQTGIFSWAGKVETGGIGDTIFTRFRVKGLTATTANIEETITHAEISLQLDERR